MRGCYSKFAFERPQSQEILDYREAVFRQKTFRMKLYAVKRKRFVGQSHDRVVRGSSGNHEMFIEGRG